MDLSHFLGRALGLYLVLKGLSVYLNRDMLMTAVKGMKSNSLLNITVASIATITGLLLVLIHNVWVSDWPVVITIFGWGLFLKGAWFLVFPENAIKVAKSWNRENFYIVGGLVTALLGAYLTLIAF